MKVLVTGATGAVGPAVVKALHNGQHSVRILTRDPPATYLFPEEIEVCRGEITDLGTLQPAMQDIDAVVHLAALLHVTDARADLRPSYERVNVGGTANIVQAAISAGVKRLVFFSTIAVYGHSSGQVLTEDSAPQPETFYGQTKLAAEQIVLSAIRPDGEPLGTVLRFAAIYGARIKGNYKRLLHSLARGRFLPIGNGCNRRTLVYDQDVASAVMLGVDHPAAAGRVYNVTDGRFHALNEIVAAICDSLGRKPPPRFLPTTPVRLVAGIIEDSARLIGRRSPIKRETIDKYTEDIAVDGARIQTELGFIPRFDLAAGWKETIREMRRNGEL